MTDPALRRRKFIRAAQPSDIDRLVEVELGAFADAYGDPPSADTVTLVRTMLADRIALLGDWFRVLLSQDRIVGMLVAVPTDLAEHELAAIETWDGVGLRRVYQPDGDLVWIANFAVVAPAANDASALDLILDGSQQFRSRGKRAVYFMSRLPGLRAWVAARHPGSDIELMTYEDRRAAAECYWRSTAEQAGRQRPIDELLRMYVDIGAQPLQLVAGWPLDRASLGFGVFCRSMV